jgi:hypothetical protein
MYRTHWVVLRYEAKNAVLAGIEEYRTMLVSVLASFDPVFAPKRAKFYVRDGVPLLSGLVCFCFF